MTILDSGDYAAIRAVLGMDSTNLPDATIALFLGSADREVKWFVPGWASLSGDDLAVLEGAAIYLTAERIARGTPAMNVSGFGFSIDETSISADSLRALALRDLALLGVVLSSAYGYAVQSTRADGYTNVEAAL